MRIVCDKVTETVGQTVAVGHGYDDEGNDVTFAGDWRPMRDLAEAVLAQGEVAVHVEDWQILSVTREAPPF